MRERKYVKFRVDMCDDTKFKIIEMKPERDLIHYVWNRVVLLAGKVDLEGELYISKNIPYSMETISIEFNRSVEQIKIAFDILIELEMLELIDDKIYRVKNFAKHQNIKIKEKDKVLNVDNRTKNKEIHIKENFKDEVKDIKDEEVQEKIINGIKSGNNHEIEEIKSISDLKVNNKDICKVDDSLRESKEKKNIGNSMSMMLDVNKIKVANKKKRKSSSSDIVESTEEEDSSVSYFGEGEYKLSPDERILTSFTFE